jgi:hypothetical protein
MQTRLETSIWMNHTLLVNMYICHTSLDVLPNIAFSFSDGYMLCFPQFLTSSSDSRKVGPTNPQSQHQVYSMHSSTSRVESQFNVSFEYMPSACIGRYVYVELFQDMQLDMSGLTLGSMSPYGCAPNRFQDARMHTSAFGPAATF